MNGHTLAVYNALLTLVFTVLWGGLVVGRHSSIPPNHVLDVCEQLFKAEASLFGALTALFLALSAIAF
ncbi:MAG: hypothetical protein DRI26_02125 [Chloroflexi bacterium]|mgnify:CR=1 FL=1|nr:MAG: hypothetical protein DRI26_02125 [Chloroflexota bacterium]